ncbi:sulfur carrier protein ThiS [Bacillus xiapuensis]|uniref:sulfur carrier protein ThiS n=1 Tax=Bacillus xiapuensis TaxID=2014075 RepID=UPI000C24F926|nr:sulfur carrier protein ThiS [Bacillus xiapuensis]
MNVVINGKKEKVDLSDSTAAALLKAFDLDRKTVIVEVNGKIIPKNELETAGIADGDRIELVHFVGGG